MKKIMLVCMAVFALGTASRTWASFEEEALEAGKSFDLTGNVDSNKTGAQVLVGASQGTEETIDDIVARNPGMLAGRHGVPVPKVAGRQAKDGDPLGKVKNLARAMAVTAAVGVGAMFKGYALGAAGTGLMMTGMGLFIIGFWVGMIALQVAFDAYHSASPKWQEKMRRHGATGAGLDVDLI